MKSNHSQIQHGQNNGSNFCRTNFNTISQQDVWVWAPVLASEPQDMLLKWIHTVEAAGFCNIILIFNGSGSESASLALRKAVSSRQVQFESLPGSASIGRCQNLAMHLFLRSDALFMARIDPDGQFPIYCLERLLHLFMEKIPPDVIVGQRDEAGVAGRSRFLGNIFLRLIALYSGIFADPNSGLYIMNRRAAALLCSVPLPKYPEPRMLASLREGSLRIATGVIPILRRQSGTSSIKGLWRSIRVFAGSLMEMKSCNLL